MTSRWRSSKINIGSPTSFCGSGVCTSCSIGFYATGEAVSTIWFLLLETFLPNCSCSHWHRVIFIDKKILIIGIATFSRKVFYDPVRLLFFSAMTIKVWTITQSQKVTPIPRGSKKRQKRFRRESVLGRWPGRQWTNTADETRCDCRQRQQRRVVALRCLLAWFISRVIASQRPLQWSSTIVHPL